jgi:hypothetical protein
MIGQAKRKSEWEQEQDQLISRRRYGKMVVVMVASVSAVAVVPLLIMSGITYRQYEDAFHAELTRPMLRFAEAGKASVESYLSERLSALAVVTRENSVEELRDEGRLASLLANLNQTFGGVVDLSLIDEGGYQVAYVGPQENHGVNYARDPARRPGATALRAARRDRYRCVSLARAGPIGSPPGAGSGLSPMPFFGGAAVQRRFLHQR